MPAIIPSRLLGASTIAASGGIAPGATELPIAVTPGAEGVAEVAAGGTYAGRAAVAMVDAAADAAADAATLAATGGAAGAAAALATTVDPQWTQNFAPGWISLLQVVHFIAVLRLHSKRWTPSAPASMTSRALV
jgi:hypothetical protein